MSFLIFLIYKWHYLLLTLSDVYAHTFVLTQFCIQVFLCACMCSFTGHVCGVWEFWSGSWGETIILFPVWTVLPSILCQHQGEYTLSPTNHTRLKKSEVWQQMISFGWTVHFTFFRLTLFPPIILLDAGICKHVIGQQRTQLCSTSSPLPMGRRAQTSCLETQCLKRNVKWPL